MFMSSTLEDGSVEGRDVVPSMSSLCPCSVVVVFEKEKTFEFDSLFAGENIF